MSDDKYADELSEKYLGCMREIKYRTDVIQRFLRLECNAGYLASTAECIALQFRKTLELIALASLVANREEYSKQRANFGSDWNAKKIVDTLETVNPKFYPVPTKPVRMTAEDMVDYDLQPVAEYLTRDDYIVLFDKCCDLLHAANPYSNSQPPYEQFMNEAPDWLRKTMALLSHHHIYPLDSNMMFIVQMGGANQNVSLTPFVEVGSTDTLLTEEGKSVKRGDLTGLTQVLTNVGVPSGEVDALKAVIEEESEGGNKIGPKTGDWFKHAKQAAASGRWSLTQGATIATVRAAILSYFGLGVLLTLFPCYLH